MYRLCGNTFDAGRGVPYIRTPHKPIPSGSLPILGRYPRRIFGLYSSNSDCLYGKSIWSLSVYSGNTGLINNYISPIIGSMKLKDVTARVLEKYYMQLLKTPAVVQHSHQQKAKNDLRCTAHGEKGTQYPTQRVSPSCEMGPHGEEPGDVRHGAKGGNEKARNLGCADAVPCHRVM